jgi:salicylate hydroxylase
MVAIRTGSILSGANLQTIVPNYYVNIKENYGAPIYSVHRVDLHDQLKALATGEAGPGQPCKLHVRSTVKNYVSNITSTSPAVGVSGHNIAHMFH